MISVDDLKRLVQARIDDAQALLEAQRYDGAVYLCGYAIELALKAAICETLGWKGFPSERKEFEGLISFKTHNLELLLRLTGREDEIKTRHTTAWLQVVTWDPEVRYQATGSAHRESAGAMLQSARELVKVLCLI